MYASRIAIGRRGCVVVEVEVTMRARTLTWCCSEVAGHVFGRSSGQLRLN
jgi:hypothetical protein